jgi:hypothetical protein
MEGLSVEAVTIDENCLFRRFHLFVAFQFIPNNMRMY